MQITRRNFLAATLAAIPVAPILNAAADLISMPIQITTAEGKARLSYLNRCFNAEIDTPIHEWPNIVEKDPRAFTSYSYSFCEEWAGNIIAHELASRAKRDFLHKLPDLLQTTSYPHPLTRIDIEIKLCDYLEFQAKQLLDKAKCIPELKLKSVDDMVLCGGEYSSPRSYYLRRHPGTFTTFTEDEAVELTNELKQIPYGIVLAAIQNRWTRPMFF